GVVESGAGWAVPVPGSGDSTSGARRRGRRVAPASPATRCCQGCANSGPRDGASARSGGRRPARAREEPGPNASDFLLNELGESVRRKCPARPLARGSHPMSTFRAVPAADLELLRKFDTPTICNVVELFELRPRTAGYMSGRIQACFPKLPPMVGYAS